MNASADLQNLLSKQLAGTLSVAEKGKLLVLLNRPDYRQQYNLLVEAAIQEASEQPPKETTRDIEAIIEYVLQYEQAHELPPTVHRIRFLRRNWFPYAAAIIIIFVIGAYLWNTQQKHSSLITENKQVQANNDVLPGNTKATLILSDGRKVELTSETGTITDTGISIRNTNGRLEYGKAKKVVFNTMTTPRGGQYQLTLPDGTNVWLNAASSITYPTAFLNNIREVTITGEVYFEVRKNSIKPFVVKTPKEDITVLGTTFNVNVYPEEGSMKTSLLQGSVKVAKLILRPGQAYTNGKIVTTNIEQDVAWKNGLFDFDGADLQTVLRQLGRWYDIEVRYEGHAKPGKFKGRLHRDLTLLQIMEVLEETGVRFRLQGKTLFVE